VPIKPLLKWVQGAVPRLMKRSWREADYWPPSSAELKTECSYIPTLARHHGCTVTAKGKVMR
jgi:hypothetical protein